MNWASQFQVLRLRFAYQTADDLDLSPWTGAVLHGAIGRAAQRISPLYGMALYPTSAGVTSRAAPNPFILHPGDIGPRKLPKNSNFSLEIALFGKAALATTAAVSLAEAIALNGLGRARTPLKLLRVDQVLPNLTPRSLVDLESGCSLEPCLTNAADIIDAAMSVMPRGNRIAVEFETPAQLTQNDKALRQAPTFHTLATRIAARISMIANEIANIPVEKSDLASWLRSTEQVGIASDNTQWRSYSDTARKGGAPRQFGGLVGKVVYEGPWEHASPLLALGRWVGIGKKTSFGFGNINTDFIQWAN